MERWDIYDIDGKATGKTVLRGGVRLNAGEYHLVVHIWVMTRDGRLLIQRRSDSKELMPGEWAAIGGAAVSGEDSPTAARRELFEEMGIKTADGDLTLIRRIIRKTSFVDVWLLKTDVSVESLRLQESEVSEAKLITVSDFEKMVDEGRFHNYGSDYFEILLEAVKSAREAGAE